jgi:hypothetical protein
VDGGDARSALDGGATPGAPSYVEASTEQIVEHLTAIYTAVAESSVVRDEDPPA